MVEVFLSGFRERRIFHKSIQNSTSECGQSCTLLLKEVHCLVTHNRALLHGRGTRTMEKNIQ